MYKRKLYNLQKNGTSGSPEDLLSTAWQTTGHRVFNKANLDTDYFTLRNWALNLQT